ncbi:uncharacterized protein LOC128681261 [Plodia interpunctella]|uniref:uncharacterized protein LOC128681261 n=1 Tax=Plodia interpunctella TaxID=58824 RepID=UPI00236875E9|nr:uncharacterized protein LOC128681261 [Plodia interpunctella]
MRRVNRNGRGGGGGGGSSNGPLLTEHLRDLDLELELLKRKREMIEKQQNLLNQQQAFNRVSYNYDQPQSFRNHQPFDDGSQFSGANHAFSSSSRDYSNCNRDFSQLYDEPQQSHSHFRQSAKKRLGDYVWSDPPSNQGFYEPPAKKPYSQPRKYNSGQNSRSKYVPPSERPGFAPKKQNGRPAPSQRFREGPQRHRPNDFKPTKVTKPNRPVNVQPLIPNPVKHMTPRVNEGSPILLADHVPSQQTVGRLELALGEILKVVKDKYGKEPAYAHCFAETGSCRGMKQLIRERIRETMLGKPVGNVAQIMQVYRAVYPLNTDKDIIEAGIQKKDKKKATEFNMSTGNNIMNPFQFFKRNYNRLLSVSLNKMFAKLEALAKEESELLLKSENEGKDKTETSTGDVGMNNTDTETSKDCMVKNDVAENPEENTENVANNSEKPVENAEKPAEDTEKPAEDAQKPAADPGGENDKPVGTENPKHNVEELEADKALRQRYEVMLDQVILKRMSMWLPRMKVQIMRVLSHDITFERAKQAIIKETNVRLSLANEPIEPGSEISKLEDAIMNKKPHKLDYHVKIQGRPTLPKKSVMTEFLAQFNPKLVKKIKNVRNLLYVGFDNKSDFDRMVAANGTFIGNEKIIVKISQWVTSSALNTPSENTSAPNTSDITDEDVTMRDASKENNEVLNDTLNNQIDELLTSIRNEELENVASNGAVDEDNGDVQAVIDDKNKEKTEENTQSDDVELIEAEEEVIDLDGQNENGNGETIQEKEKTNVDNTEAEAKDTVEELITKETGRATPTRASARLATTSTPSSVRTRRASKLAQN